MKRVIMINQQALIEEGFAFLDMTDAALLDFIYSWRLYDKSEKREFNGKAFVWVSHKLLTRQLPLAHIETYRGWLKRLQKLERLGLLELFSENEKERKCWVRLTASYDAVIFEKSSTGVGDARQTPLYQRSGYPCTSVHANIIRIMK